MSAALAFLHLTTFYPPYNFGGDGVYVERLAGRLADAGHVVEVAHCVDAYRLLHPAPPPRPARPHPGVTVHAMESGARWLSPLVTHATGAPGLKARRLREILGRRSWDVVHFHNISLLGPGVLELVADATDAITLYTAHEHWLVCPTHVLWKFNSRPCQKPLCAPCALSAGRPPQLWRYTGLLERASARVDRFVSPSRASAALHAERGFERPMAYLPHFTERADDDWREPPPRPHARPYFLYVGRLERMKGVADLVDCWRTVQDADLLVAGAGGLAPALRRAARQNRRVRLLGDVPPERLGALYAHALGCVVPSIGHEVFPLVVLEALSRKTPIVARDFGALGEVAAESGGALLFRDDSGLRDALARLAASPALRTELGERGYRTFLERWSPEAHLAGYFSLIEGVAAERQRRAAGAATA